MAHLIVRRDRQARRALPAILAVLLMAGCGASGPATAGRSMSAAGHQSGARPAASTGQRGTVYLTFDDGPDAVYTPQVLAVLHEYEVHATFFEIGRNVTEHPDVTRMVLAAGDKVGNHTWSHADLARLSTVQIRRQLDRMETALGHRPRCVRAPYGAVNARVGAVLKQRGQLEVLWTVDTRDWSRPGVARIVERVLKHVGPDARILMHDGGGDRSQTVQALRIIIPTLLRRGYAFGQLPC